MIIIVSQFITYLFLYFVFGGLATTHTHIARTLLEGVWRILKWGISAGIYMYIGSYGSREIEWFGARQWIKVKGLCT